MEEQETTPQSDSGLRDVTGLGFACYEIIRPTEDSLEELKRRLPFLVDEDLSDCLPPFERPKLIERENYLFAVLLYPRYDEMSEEVRPTEVDFLIGKDFLAIVHDGSLPEMRHLVTRRSPHLTPILMMIEMAHELTVTRFPILKDISNELIEIEKGLFDSGNGDLIRNILKARSNILAFRESMQGHTMALSKLHSRGKRLFDAADSENVRLETEELISHIEDIWNFLSNDRETAEALYESHLTLVTMKTNQAMKSLTALAFVIFPTTLAAAIFAMGAEHMPISGHPYDFWIMLGVVLAVMVSILTFVKLKKWL